MSQYLCSLSYLMILLLGVGCSSAPATKTQAYAELSNHRVFEYEFPAVWKGIETTLKEYHVTGRDPEEVDSLELRKIKKRTLNSDWVYSQSRDKYEEYDVNGSPRKKYLQTRVKFHVIAETEIGGTRVEVQTSEEIEKLKPDGSPAGYERPEKVDSSRAAELLDKINLSILSASP